VELTNTGGYGPLPSPIGPLRYISELSPATSVLRGVRSALIDGSMVPEPVIAEPAGGAGRRRHIRCTTRVRGTRPRRLSLDVPRGTRWVLIESAMATMQRATDT
jgi:hypothetical protein